MNDNLVPDVKTPMTITIDGFEYRNIVRMIRDERGLFLEYYGHETLNEESMRWALHLAFWTGGITGSLRCEGVERANVFLNKRGELVTKYVQKADWASYNHCWSRDNPNWAIRGSRGMDARWGWEIRESPPTIQKVEPFLWGNETDSKLGKPGESFEKFFTFLNFAPDLVEWVKEDRAIEEDRVAKAEARYKANLAKRRAKIAEKRAERENVKRAKRAEVEVEKAESA